MKIYQMDEEALKKNNMTNLVLLLFILTGSIYFIGVFNLNSLKTIIFMSVWFIVCIYIVSIILKSNKYRFELSNNILRVYCQEKLYHEFNLKTDTIKTKSSKANAKFGTVTVTSLIIIKNNKQHMLNNSMIGENAFSELLVDIKKFLPKE